jgi:GNAT superfamily N-acetyltransferase
MPSEKNWRVTLFDRRFLPGLLDLLNRTGHSTDEERFLWEFEANPAGALNVHVALHQDRIVGVASHNVFRMWIDTQEHEISFPLQVVTDPLYRGQGIFSELELACEDRASGLGYPCMLSFPNDASTPIFLNKLGWNRLEGPRYLLRPGRQMRVPEEVNAFKAVTEPLARLGGRVATLLEGMHRTSGFVMHEEQNFGPWADALFEENKPHLDRCLVRDSTHLNWRYADKPGSLYRIFRFASGGETIGYIVLGKTLKRNLPFHYVASALFAPDHRGKYAISRRDALRGNNHASAAGVLELSDSSLKESIRGLPWGFSPTPKKLHFIGKSLNPTGDVILGNQLPWRVQVGDLDFF